MNLLHSRIGLAAAVILTAGISSFAQAPGVKIVRDRGEDKDALVDRANEARLAGKLLHLSPVTEQIQRTNCELKLPAPAKKKISDRQVWQRGVETHVRVGWNFLCKKCDDWHLNLSGGYFITADGVVATCYHVVKPKTEHRDGYLVVIDDSGKVFPVVELLAGNEITDVAIVKTKVEKPVKPLALNTDVYPGDPAWCYSDPLGRGSYFSKGMVNRFFVQNRKDEEAVRIEVSTDWAPGSSGSAVLDECGNAIGHVADISGAASGRARATNSSPAAVIVFHSAARAADVLSLVKPPAKQ